MDCKKSYFPALSLFYTKFPTMKNIFLLIATAISISAATQVRVGGITGINFSDIENKDLLTTSRQGNLLVGLMADFKFSKSSGFHIVTQAVYAPMGYSKSNLPVQDNLGNQFGTIVSHRIGYIQVPVYFSYSGETKKSKIGAGLGPYISIKTGDKLKVKGGDAFGNASILPAGIKKINSTVTGIGINFTAEFSSFLLALHYQQSFSGIYESQLSQDHWKINSFGLSLGYFFTKTK
jgi:hypothetical protein